MKHIGYAALVALAFAGGGPARAQAPGSSGVLDHVPSHVGNVVGGGVATIYGGGDEMVIVYSGGGAGRGGALAARAGRMARIYGGGEGAGGPELEYLQPAPTPRGPGREAWMFGDGNGGAEVVYAPPHRLLR